MNWETKAGAREAAALTARVLEVPAAVEARRISLRYDDLAQELIDGVALEAFTRPLMRQIEDQRSAYRASTGWSYEPMFGVWWGPAGDFHYVPDAQPIARRVMEYRHYYPLGETPLYRREQIAAEKAERRKQRQEQS